MIEPKLEVPAELRELAEKTIDQAEKAFGMFFDAASKSMTSVPGAGSEISKQALTFTEQNMKAAFEHARKLVQATDLQEAMRIQSEFLRSQFTSAGEHMRQITGTVMSSAKDAALASSESSKISGGIGSASVVAGIGDHRPGGVAGARSLVAASRRNLSSVAWIFSLTEFRTAVAQLRMQGAGIDDVDAVGFCL